MIEGARPAGRAPAMFLRGAAPWAAVAVAAASWLNTCAGQADFAPYNADCKDGYELFKEAKTGYVGCYKYWHTTKNWDEAKIHCEGRNGNLAAARSQAEQSFLMELVTKHSWGANFYTSGNSKSSTKQWIWGDPYNAAVVFNNPAAQAAKTWDNGMIVDTIPRGKTSAASHFADSVVLNGFRAAYAWKIVSGADAHSFVCRKDACSPGYDVTDQLCVVHSASASSSEDLAWVAAPVVIVLLIAGLGAAAFIFKPHWLPCFGDGRGNRVASHNDNAILNDQVRSQAILNLPAIRPKEPLELPAIRMQNGGGVMPGGALPTGLPRPTGSKERDEDADSTTTLPAIKPGAIPDSDDESAGGGSRPITGKSMVSMTSIPEDLRRPLKLPTLDVVSVNSGVDSLNFPGTGSDSRPNTGGRPGASPLNPVRNTD